MNSKKALETVLNGLDTVGFQLSALGITDKVNRHNCLALLFAEQQHLKGELDSLTVKVETSKYRLEKLRDDVEGLVNERVETAIAPIRSSLSSVRGLISSSAQ